MRFLFSFEMFEKFLGVRVKYIEFILHNLLNCLIVSDKIIFDHNHKIRRVLYMNILVIGNGFDLAHDLPTKYTDFLCFIKVIMEIFDKFSSENSEIDWGEINSQIRKQIWKDMGNVRDNLYSKEAMWKDLIWNNFWIDYFQQNSMYQKENWIDFESEISKVI